MYKTDWLREPTTLLKNEQEQVGKAGVRPGDLLLVQSKDFVVASEQVTLHLYVTLTGLPGEDTLTQDLMVPFDLHLGELRTRIFSLDLFTPPAKSSECIRLRERTKTGHYGKIYREDGKSLKTLKISYGSEVVCQAFEEPEQYTSGLGLFVSVRDSAARTTSKPKECTFDGSPNPTIDDLYSFVLSVTDLPWNLCDLALAKYVPHMFTWEPIDDPREASQRGSLLGTPSTKSKSGIYNLKKSPVNLKEGDLIAVKHTLDDPGNTDDFSCEGDRVRREEVAAEKRASQKGDQRRKNKEGGVRILA